MTKRGAIVQGVDNLAQFDDDHRDKEIEGGIEEKARVAKFLGAMFVGGNGGRFASTPSPFATITEHRIEDDEDEDDDESVDEEDEPQHHQQRQQHQQQQRRVKKEPFANVPSANSTGSGGRDFIWTLAKVLIGSVALTGLLFLLSHSRVVPRMFTPETEHFSVPTHYLIVFIMACIIMLFVV